MEMQLLYEALLKDIPLLGICRGMQIFNVFHGGTLIQHIDKVELHHHRFSAENYRAIHSVDTILDSRLSRICNAEHFTVNSRHHQAIRTLGTGLTISAVSEDNVIEAIELPTKQFAVAVQWHPEDRIYSVAQDKALFAAFAHAVTKVVYLMEA